MAKTASNKQSSSEAMNIGRMGRILGRFMRGQVNLFSMAGLMLVFEAATAVLIPLLAAFMIDYLAVRLAQLDGKAIAPPLSPLGALGFPTIFNPDVDTVVIVTMGIVLLTMVNSLGDSMAEIYLAKGGRQVGYNLRTALYAHLQKLSLAFHDQRRTGDILTRVTSDVAALEDFIISSLSDFVGSVLLIGFILIVMVMNAWQVALVALVIIPIMALVSNYFTQRIKAASKRLRASEGELASAAQEMLTSIRVIQTYGLGSFEQGLFAAQSRKAMNSALEAAAYQARFSWVVSVLGAASVAVIIWLAVWLIFRAPITASGIGLLTAYIKYIQDMFKPTKRIIQEWNTFGKLYASVERVGDLLDMQPSVQDEPGAVDAPQFMGQIEFRGVHFSYPAIGKLNGDDGKGRTTLKDVNFEIKPGQVVAVVGHTGAGKSTIAQLIPRLYDPNAGEVCIDGQDIRKFTLESLRSQISVVLQESILFSGSVVENIAYGRPDATGAEILTAAKQANADEFIQKLPEGYYAMLGERGSNLSGGQRQRIAIARAFIRNTPILVMDEPTTGLDAESTDLVLAALNKLMKGKTTIIISHDLNLIRNADKIIVIKAGEIEQMGTHDELIREGGLYANLYTRQSGQASVPIGASLTMFAPLPVTAAGGSPAQPDLSDLDLPHSPQLAAKLPALSTAFNAEQMTRLIQQEMIGASGSRFIITSCAPGKAIYLPDNHCDLQYVLKIRDATNGVVRTALLNANLFPNLADCKAYLHASLEPLVRKMNGRPEIDMFAHPVMMFEALKMTAAVFPIDGQMPTLIQATDPTRMLEIFNETLPDALSGNFTIHKVSQDLAHYGRYRRCVLRYTLDGEGVDGQSPDSQVVYGKVDADGQGGLTVSVISALRERLRDPDVPFHFRIPLAYSYLPNLKLLLMEAIPGEPVIKSLIKHQNTTARATQANGLNLEEAIEICARMVATVHWSGIRLGRRHPFETEIELVEEEMRPVQALFPELGSALNGWLREVLDYAQTYPALPLRFSHGDFTYTQLIFSGKEAGLVDFDSVCLAEPAFDLGQYIAYQRLSIVKEQDPDTPFDQEVTDQLCELFLRTYMDVSREWLPDEGLLRARVAVYEIISLIRLVLHSWQKLKGNRLGLAIQLLEERLACLKQVS